MKSIPNNIGEYLAYSPTSPSGLIWRKNNKIAGCQKAKGYWHIRLNKENYLAHRVIWFLATGEDPEVMLVDHKDGNPANNLKSNLRLASNGQNSQNRTVENTSGVKGVYRHKGKWVARVMCNKKHIYLGRFENLEHAKLAVMEARIKYHGEFAKHE